MKIHQLLLAALCGAIIAHLARPRRYAIIERQPVPMAENQMEINSLRMAAENARLILQEQTEQTRLWKAKAASKAIALPKPKERLN